MIISKTYNTTPGKKNFSSNDLFNVKILQVARAGVIYTETITTPAGMQFNVFSSGVILFDVNNLFNLGEKINVLYEK